MIDLINYGLNERFLNEAGMYKDYEIARVISESRGIYRVVFKEGFIFANVSGKFRYELIRNDDYPAVGDFVMVSVEGDRGIIHKVLSRKSVFSRSAVGVKGQTQIVASNVDVVFICMSLNKNFNLSRLERYLSIGYDSGAVPVVVLTKSDLCQDIEDARNKVLEVAPFADIIDISYNEDVLEKLSPYLKKGATAAFIGSSGVGKSTLINRIIGSDEIKTHDTDKADKGRHTTTRRELISLNNGAVLIDTPGMRELGIETADIDKTFSDIDELSELCKFRDCSHTNEPGCAVIMALKEGSLDKRRYENYLKLKKEMKYDGMSSKKLEEEKLERIFKDVGGMKNARKYIRESNKRK